MKDPKKEMESAAVHDAGGVVTGYLAKGPCGQLVKLAPQTVYLAASVEQGVHTVGVKPGWSLVPAKPPAAPPESKK